MAAIFISIVIFLLVLSILVLVHELGHFIAARIFGVKVEEFGIGFPPRATSIKKGDTVYSINWVPLGGFVKLKGEDSGAVGPDSFSAKPVWQRFVILGAGVAMNLALTISIFFIANMVGAPHIVGDYESLTTQAQDLHIRVTRVLEGFPAQKAGIAAGDRIVSLDGTPVERVEDVQTYVRLREGANLVVTIERGNETLSYPLTPVFIKESGYPGMGISLARVATITYPPHVALLNAVKTTWYMAGALLTMLFSAVRSLAFDGFMGPVGIASTTATVTKLGFSYLLNLIAQLSLSLAIFNFLPIPALDGGRALFVMIEKLRGKSVRPEVEQMVHTIGFLILIGLLLLVTIQDIRRLLPA